QMFPEAGMTCLLSFDQQAGLGLFDDYFATAEPITVLSCTQHINFGGVRVRRLHFNFSVDALDFDAGPRSQFKILTNFIARHTLRVARTSHHPVQTVSHAALRTPQTEHGRPNYEHRHNRHTFHLFCLRVLRPGPRDSVITTSRRLPKFRETELSGPGFIGQPEVFPTIETSADIQDCPLTRGFRASRRRLWRSLLFRVWYKRGPHNYVTYRGRRTCWPSASPAGPARSHNAPVLASSDRSSLLKLPCSRYCRFRASRESVPFHVDWSRPSRSF